MIQPNWKLMPLIPMQTVQVVWREWPDGTQESWLVTAEQFKAQINADEAQLEDADGNLMTAEKAKQFVGTLP